MRKIDEIIIHCTATRRGRDFTVADVTRWHRQRGFRTIGYHFLIRLDGTICEGRKLDEIGAHCKGHNARSIGICYVGGLDETGNPADTRTPAQKEALRKLVARLSASFPEASLHGHREFAAKACPCFNVHEDL